MNVRCPHCGALNRDGARGRPCVSCGRPLPGEAPRQSDFDGLAALGLDRDPDFSSSPDTLEDDAGGGLGAIPSGDDLGPLDLGSLLGAGGGGHSGGHSGGQRDDRGFYDDAAFRFGGDDALERTERGLGSLDGGFAAFDDDEEATRGNLMVQIPPEALRDSLDMPLTGGHDPIDDDEEESTRVVDHSYVEQAMSEAPLSLAEPTPVGWRVRNERGVVYELMTVDAVVAWLEGKPDITGVRVARGDGAFLDVDAFPELASRLGVRAPVEELLALDTTRASERHRGNPGAARSHGQSAAVSATAAREPTGERVGLGVVLAAIAGGFLAVAAIVLVSVSLDVMSLPPPIDDPPPATAAPSAALVGAIEDYEGGHYDAATLRLQALARTDDDPRVYRYLALALHQNNREAEARRALAEYRRLMRGVDGAR